MYVTDTAEGLREALNQAEWGRRDADLICPLCGALVPPCRGEGRADFKQRHIMWHVDLKAAVVAGLTAV